MGRERDGQSQTFGPVFPQEPHDLSEPVSFGTAFVSAFLSDFESDFDSDLESDFVSEEPPDFEDL